MKKLLAIILTIITTSLVYCQSASKNPEENKSDSTTMEKIARCLSFAESIVEFTEPAVENRKPANFIAVFPELKKSSYNINFAAKFSVYDIKLSKNSSKPETTQSFLTPYLILGFNRNTSIDDESNNLKWGIGVSYHLKNKSPLKYNLNVSMNFNDNKDYIDNTYSVQSGVYFNFNFTSSNSDEYFFYYLFPNKSIDVFHNGYFHYQISPFIGFEYDNAYKNQNNQPKDYKLLNLYKIAGNLSVFEDKIINFFIEYHYRINISNNNVNQQKYFRFFQTGLNINILKSISDVIYLSLGLDYISGENPLAGFMNQHYGQFSLKFKM